VNIINQSSAAPQPWRERKPEWATVPIQTGMGRQASRMP